MDEQISRPEAVEENVAWQLAKTGPKEHVFTGATPENPYIAVIAGSKGTVMSYGSDVPSAIDGVIQKYSALPIKGAS